MKADGEFLVPNKSLNRRWLAFEFFKLVCFAHGVWFVTSTSLVRRAIETGTQSPFRIQNLHAFFWN